MRMLKFTPAFALALGLLVTGSPNAADPPAKEPTEKDVEQAEKKADLVTDLATAAELAAFGRGQSCEATSPKNAKSPEALVLAGGILWRADKAVGGKTGELDVTPTDEKGKALELRPEKLKSFKQQATELFDEARAMAAEGGDKSRTAAVEAMIKREEASEATRGAVGGPKRAGMVIAPGATQNFKLAFVGGLPAVVAMQGNGTAKLHITITHVGGNRLFGLKGVNAIYNWRPDVDRNGVRWFDVSVTNLGKVPTAYILATN
jgi:hypothetical protein